MDKVDISSLSENEIENIKAVIKNAANCLGNIEAEKEQIGIYAGAIKDQFDIPKALFNKIVKLFYEQSLEDKKEEIKILDGIYYKLLS